MKPFTKKPFRGKVGPKKEGGLRVNREIYAQQVRVVDEEGKVLGVFSLHQALELADNRSLDLIEIAPTAQPPTCKLMDYGKWKYENKKKAVQARKNQVVIDIKEVQLRPRTEQHDLETKMRHARRFLLEGDKVKVNLRFSGREMAYQDVGMSVLDKFAQGIIELAVLEVPAKKEGRQVFMLFAPDPAKIKDYKKSHPEQFAKEKATAMPESEADEGDEAEA